MTTTTRPSLGELARTNGIKRPAVITATSPQMAATTHAPSNTLNAFFATGTKPNTQAGLSAMLDEIRSLVLLANSPGASIISGNTGEAIVARTGFLKPSPAPQARPAAPAQATAIRPPQASASTPKATAPKAQAPVRTETPTLDRFNSLKGGMATLFYRENEKAIRAEQSVRTSEERAAARAKK